RARRRGRRRRPDLCDRGWRAAAFAVGEPYVVDRVLDRMEAGTGREHPASEDALDLGLQRDLVDLDEGVGVLRLGGRARVARARRHLQRAELHGFVDRHVERGDAACDLVEAREHRGRVDDLLRRRRYADLIAWLRPRVGLLLRSVARGTLPWWQIGWCNRRRRGGIDPNAARRRRQAPRLDFPRRGA